MKKVSAIIVLLCILFTAGCSGNKPAVIVTSNMFVYEDTGKSFLSARGRYEAVVNVIRNEVTVLENAHNEKIIVENPDDYFLNNEYILSSFDPFNIDNFALSEFFDEKTDQSLAQTFYSNYAAGRDIQYSSSDKEYNLKFISDGMNEIYSVICSDNFDSFRFEHLTVSSDGENCEDFLDFVRISDNTYAIQSSLNRCYIQFDSEGHIDYFRFSQIKDGINDIGNSIFKSSAVIGKSWVTNNKTVTYSSIIEFKDRILTHQDSSTGTLKEISVNEDDFASGFII